MSSAVRSGFLRQSTCVGCIAVNHLWQAVANNIHPSRSVFHRCLSAHVQGQRMDRARSGAMKTLQG